MDQQLTVWKIALGVFIGTLGALLAAWLISYAVATISAPPTISPDLENQMMLDAQPPSNGF